MVFYVPDFRNIKIKIKKIIFMKKLKLFFSRLFATFALLAYCTQCFAVIIVDVDVCYRPISFMIDNYNKKKFDRSIRVLEYDSDVNKINFIHYYPYGHRIPSFQHDYRDFVIEYDGNTQSFVVIPKSHTTMWIRSFGQINSLSSENLSILDETRNGYSLLKQSPLPDYASTLEKIINYLNYFDIPLKGKNNGEKCIGNLI